MTPAQIRQRLDEDLQSYRDAGTAADRQAALAQWMVDITLVVQGATMFPMNRLLRVLLDRGVLWNPELRTQIGDE